MNKNEIIVKQKDYLVELKSTQELCNMLMKSPHYAKMGQEGIFAIATTAKSLGIDPVQALMGGLYFVKGKVEMTSRMMAALIRSKKHSITKDSKSNQEICILHGKRSDTKDCWTASFSIAEARKAGLVKDYGPWVTYPERMLYARALSILGRELFPDIIGNCYVVGEISLDPNIKEATTYHNDDQNDSISDTKLIENTDSRTDEEVKALMDLFNIVPDYKKEIELFLRKKEILALKDIPKEMYTKVLKRAKEKVKEYMGNLQDRFSEEDLEVANA